MKTLFLLGAGASVEAGLPTSAGLNAKVLELAERCEGGWRPVGAAIEWAHRQMLKRVDNPWEANIELLFNILDEAAGQPRLPASAVFRHLHRPARRANRKYQQVISRPSPNPYSLNAEPDVFRQAQGWIGESLPGWLTIKEAESARFLVPLLEYCQKTESCIATLNYDNVVESASSLSGILVDDGLAHWTELRQLSYAPEAVPLIKLHGSLNWIELDERLDGGKKRRPTVRRESEFDRKPGRQRVVIFGGQNKMTYRPPFPDLYSEFRRRIMEVDAVCVLGYSGADPHVNQVLFDWAFAQDNRLFSEATCYGEVYSRIFGVGPFHRHDTLTDFKARPHEVTRMNRHLQLNVHEWPKSKKPHTETYLKSLRQILDERGPT
ncbi:MAG: SIR2 family protein [Fimbriimonadaceae bacterium]|nr:SIR2 family protein [Fimbriimonadaceae bacterium]